MSDLKRSDILKAEYQEGILPNLLSGFYERCMLERRDVSLYVIFKELRREFKKLEGKE
jgi:hypothetical protein